MLRRRLRGKSELHEGVRLRKQPQTITKSEALQSHLEGSTWQELSCGQGGAVSEVPLITTDVVELGEWQHTGFVCSQEQDCPNYIFDIHSTNMVSISH